MKIFVDSSILIEYIKGSRVDLLEKIINDNHEISINSIVASEFLYHYLGLISGQSPRTIKEKQKIKETFLSKDPVAFLQIFNIVDTTGATVELAMEFMKKYNLLPNDAMIIADCKLNQIKHLASYDSDFSVPLKAEKISLFE